MNDKNRNSPGRDSCWEAAWSWVLRQHETGFDNAAFNAELNQWLQADPAHRKAYDDAARIWAATGLLPPVNHLLSPDCNCPEGE